MEVIAKRIETRSRKFWLTVFALVQTLVFHKDVNPELQFRCMEGRQWPSLVYGAHHHDCSGRLRRDPEWQTVVISRTSTTADSQFQKGTAVSIYKKTKQSKQDICTQTIAYDAIFL